VKKSQILEKKKERGGLLSTSEFGRTSGNDDHLVQERGGDGDQGEGENIFYRREKCPIPWELEETRPSRSTPVG